MLNQSTAFERAQVWAAQELEIKPEKQSSSRKKNTMRRIVTETKRKTAQDSEGKKSKQAESKARSSTHHSDDFHRAQAWAERELANKREVEQTKKKRLTRELSRKLAWEQQWSTEEPLYQEDDKEESFDALLQPAPTRHSSLVRPKAAARAPNHRGSKTTAASVYWIVTMLAINLGLAGYFYYMNRFHATPELRRFAKNHAARLFSMDEKMPHAHPSVSAVVNDQAPSSSNPNISAVVGDKATNTNPTVSAIMDDKELVDQIASGQDHEDAIFTILNHFTIQSVHCGGDAGKNNPFHVTNALGRPMYQLEPILAVLQALNIDYQPELAKLNRKGLFLFDSTGKEPLVGLDPVVVLPEPETCPV